MVYEISRIGFETFGSSGNTDLKSHKAVGDSMFCLLVYVCVCVCVCDSVVETFINVFP